MQMVLPNICRCVYCVFMGSLSSSRTVKAFLCCRQQAMPEDRWQSYEPLALDSVVVSNLFP